MAPTLRWDRVEWTAFLRELENYRRRIEAGASEDRTYRDCLVALGDLSFGEIAEKTEVIVTFLNAWHCRVSTPASSAVLAAWISENEAELTALSRFRILDEELDATWGRMDGLYEDLHIRACGMINNWSDAATSKSLHQLLPNLSVMWDSNIRPFAVDYGDFIREMSGLGHRLVAESPFTPGNVETGLSEHLGSNFEKSFAKYLDEYNWWVMVGSRRRVGQPAD